MIRGRASAESLLAKSNGRYDQQFIEELVAQIARDFDSARFGDYVEVLIAKEAADELRRLRALTPVASYL